jgi:hypothetical protein
MPSKRVKPSRLAKLQDLDLQRRVRLSIPGAPRALQYLASVPGQQGQDLVLVTGQGILGAGPGPEQDAQCQARGRVLSRTGAGWSGIVISPA